jgi:effector-binding domain-containing protein
VAVDDRVRIEFAEPRLLAAVHRRAGSAEIGSVWRPALDAVWALLRRRTELHAGGHNVFVYQHPARPGDPMDIEFGVEVVRRFDADGEVRCIDAPSGRAATVTHVGPIAALHEAYEALDAWGARTGERFAPVSWEVYGDWGDDPSTQETRIFRSLA